MSSSALIAAASPPFSAAHGVRPCLLLAEAVEKVGDHSSRIVLPQQSKLGGTMFESLLRRSVCWRINLSPRTPRNTFSTWRNSGVWEVPSRYEALLSVI